MKQLPGEYRGAVLLDFLCGCIKLVNAMTLKLHYFTDFCRKLQSPAPIAVAKVALSGIT